MQWRITGTLYETDGNIAKGQVEVQIYEIPRQRWLSLATSSLDAKGGFSISVDIADENFLPAVRLCEPVKAGQSMRVLAEGALVRVVSTRLGHLAFGDIQRLGNQAVTRSQRAAPFTSSDDYLLVGMPKATAQPSPTLATATMANIRLDPKLVLHTTQPVAGLNSDHLKLQANLTRQLETQTIDLNNKIQLVQTLEQTKLAQERDLKKAQETIQLLQGQLKAKPNATVNSEQIELATQQIRLTMNEQIIRQAGNFEIQQSELQRTLRERNFELAKVSEQVAELSTTARKAAEEAARVQEENEQLQSQLETQVNAGDLYSSIAQQLQQTQSQLQSEGSAYRLGRVSLNVKTLLSGNQLTLPNRSDLLKGNPGLFTDVTLEYLPDSPDQDSHEAGIAVPDFSDLTETLARRLAGDLGLQLEAAYQSIGTSGQSIGQAIRQLPAKGTQVAPGDSVLVVFTQA